MSRSAADIRSRIEANAYRAFRPEIWECIESFSSPDVVLSRLERWLIASGGSASHFDALQESGKAAEWFLRTLAGSSHQSDVLAQNPEFGALLLDPTQYLAPLEFELLIAEGKRLLAGSDSRSKSMDRLRQLKQRHLLVIAHKELNRLEEPPEIWRSISNLADAVLLLALHEFWPLFAAEKGISMQVPFEIAAFGKLGSHELNYSSDVDLVYLLPDGISDDEAKQISRFAVQFGKALEEPMGRGSLYRVDLRLRPFGGTGPIVSPFSAVEAYYERYAETWEHLALLRSRVVGGSSRWEALRQKVCFGTKHGLWHVDELIHQRERLEQIQIGDDLKRGPGGIRDVEFLVHTAQLIHGTASDGPLPILETIPILLSKGVLYRKQAEVLKQGYIFLRNAEHALQIDSNRQTHTLPDTEAGLISLAERLRMTLEEFLSALQKHRSQIREIYSELMSFAPPSAGGNRLTKSAVEWLDQCSPEGEFRRAAEQSDTGGGRINLIARRAAGIIHELKQSPAVTEAIISGEAAEPIFIPLAIAPKTYTELKVREGVRYLLDSQANPGASWSEIIRHVLLEQAEGLPIEIVVLGSQARRECSYRSDVDVILFSRAGTSIDEAEKGAQEWLRRLELMRDSGGGPTPDLRLRPEGKSGLLVRTPEGLTQYSQTIMEPWERLALSTHRSVNASPESLESIQDCLTADSNTLDQLLHVKHRIETERVTNPNSDFKLGPGGVEDITWLCGVTALLHHNARTPDPGASTPDRIAALGLSAADAARITEAHFHLLHLRWNVDLLGYPESLVPTEPGQLETLASAFSQTPDEFMQNHESLRHSVRAIYERQMRSLREDKL